MTTHAATAGSERHRSTTAQKLKIVARTGTAGRFEPCAAGSGIYSINTSAGLTPATSKPVIKASSRRYSSS